MFEVGLIGRFLGCGMVLAWLEKGELGMVHEGRQLSLGSALSHKLERSCGGGGGRGGGGGGGAEEEERFK